MQGNKIGLSSEMLGRRNSQLRYKYKNFNEIYLKPGVALRAELLVGVEIKRRCKCERIGKAKIFNRASYSISERP